MHPSKVLNERGLTLIELIATIVILAIIAAIAIPSIQGVIQNQRDKAILSDIANMVATAKIQMTDNECIDEICTYSTTNNEISFHSSRFTFGEVDFTNGNSPDDIEITVGISPSDFKGSKKHIYQSLVSPSSIFTEADLLDALNR